MPVSDLAYSVMHVFNDRSSVGELLVAAGIVDSVDRQSIVQLWSRRMIHLRRPDSGRSGDAARLRSAQLRPAGVMEI